MEGVTAVAGHSAGVRTGERTQIFVRPKVTHLVCATHSAAHRAEQSRAEQ
jgi:hypothetical protein